jgi:hypothetical protein
MSKVSRTPRRTARRALLVLLLAAGCDSTYDPTHRSSARLIDRTCLSGAYELSGSAELVVGISEDSCAFVLGPAAGSVTVSGITSALIWTDEPERAKWQSTGALIANPLGTTWHVVDLRREVNEPSSGCGSSQY